MDVVLKPGAKTQLVFSTDESMMRAQPATLKNNELKRLERPILKDPEDAFLRDLLFAGEQFIVQRGQDHARGEQDPEPGGYTLLAGSTGLPTGGAIP